MLKRKLMKCVWSKTIGSGIIIVIKWRKPQLCGSSLYKPKKAISKKLFQCFISDRQITFCMFQVHTSNKKNTGSCQGLSFKKQNTESPLPTTSAKSSFSSMLSFVFSALYKYNTGKYHIAVISPEKKIRTNSVSLYY